MYADPVIYSSLMKKNQIYFTHKSLQLDVVKSHAFLKLKVAMIGHLV